MANYQHNPLCCLQCQFILMYIICIIIMVLIEDHPVHNIDTIFISIGCNVFIWYAFKDSTLNSIYFYTCYVMQMRFTQQGSDAHDMMPFPSLGLLHPARQMSAQLENYMRLVDLRRMAAISCGATQESIESHTFRHKYKRVNHVKIDVYVHYHIILTS